MAATPFLEASAGMAALPSAGVNKTVVSDKFRMVFIAGLEGSGHHYVEAADTAMFVANPDLLRTGKRHRLSHFPYYIPSSMSEKALNFADSEVEARDEMQRLAEHAAGLPSPGTVYVMHNSWSYPTHSGAQKVMQYIDFPRLAEVAESAGIDMRVLYLRRSAKGMVIADTVHRDFQDHLSDPVKLKEEERFLEYIRILFTDIAVLQSFLFEISPEFVVCHDWDYLGDRDQASQIAGFVAPNEEIAGLVNSSLVDTATAHDFLDEALDVDDLTFDGVNDLVARLQRKLDSFEGFYCGPKR